LVLGQKLVDELGLAQRGDTLGRWMAHYIAELLVETERGPTQAERAIATTKAVGEILRIWGHRTTAERLNPLADLKPTVAVLHALGQAPVPWMFHPSGSARAWRVYDKLRRLTICLALLEMGGIESLRKGLAKARSTSAYHGEDERAIVSFLATWLAATPASPASGRRRRKGPKQPMKTTKGEREQLLATTLAIAREAMVGLAALIETLGSEALPPSARPHKDVRPGR
jgi:hypothetical protein